jgi:hypothetical protein
MLNIFADALLTAVRMNPPLQDEHPRKPVEDTKLADRRRWLSLTGLRR